MPKHVKVGKGKEFVFKSGREGRARESQYDWDSWFNGDLLLIEQSEGEKDAKGAVVSVGVKKDFDEPINKMVFKTRLAARQRYKHLDVSRYDSDNNRLDNAFVIRARDMSDEERAQEDERREEVRAANRARKKQKEAASV